MYTGGIRTLAGHIEQREHVHAEREVLEILRAGSGVGVGWGRDRENVRGRERDGRECGKRE